jgi:cytochrome c peroxidase
MGASQLGIDLSDKDIAAIVTFLKTLTGDQPRVQYPILPPHTKGTPLPVTEIKVIEIDKNSTGEH